MKDELPDQGPEPIKKTLKELMDTEYKISTFRRLARWHGVSFETIIKEFGDPRNYPDEIPVEWTSRKIFEPDNKNTLKERIP